MIGDVTPQHTLSFPFILAKTSSISLKLISRSPPATLTFMTSPDLAHKFSISFGK